MTSESEKIKFFDRKLVVIVVCVVTFTVGTSIVVTQQQEEARLRASLQQLHSEIEALQGALDQAVRLFNAQEVRAAEDRTRIEDRLDRLIRLHEEQQ